MGLIHGRKVLLLVGDMQHEYPKWGVHEPHLENDEGSVRPTRIGVETQLAGVALKRSRAWQKSPKGQCGARAPARGIPLAGALAPTFESP